MYANDEFVKLTGYQKSDVLGKNCRFLQGELTNQETVQKIRKCIQEGTASDIQILNYRKDGTMFWNIFQLLPLRNRKGHITHFCAIQNDMSYVTIGANPLLWSPIQVASWLKLKGLQMFSKKMIDERISGSVFIDLTASDLDNMRIPVNQQQEMVNAIEEVRKKCRSEHKIISDQATHFKRRVTLGIHPMDRWSTQDVCLFLELHSLDTYQPIFIKRKVLGSELVMMDNTDLLKLGMRNPEERYFLLHQIEKTLYRQQIAVSFTSQTVKGNFQCDLSISIADLRNQLVLQNPELANKKFRLVAHFE